MPIDLESVLLTASLWVANQQQPYGAEKTFCKHLDWLQLLLKCFSMSNLTIFILKFDTYPFQKAFDFFARGWDKSVEQTVLGDS